MRYSGSVYRPPSEAYSLIVQCTLGCSHNKCAFCNMYKEKRFSIRPIEDVLAALRQAGAVPTAHTDPAPFAAVESYGESAINYLVHVWCNTDDYWTTLFEVNKNVQAIFQEKGLTMTYPHLNVHLDK